MSEEQKEQTIDTFSLLKDCFMKKKHASGVVKKLWNKYVIHRMLSDVDGLEFIANELNVRDVPAEAEFVLLQELLPTVKRVPRMTFSKDREKPDEELKLLMRFYKCDEPTARRYQVFAKKDPRILEEARYYAGGDWTEK